ncbi:MAG: hypothetical protein ACPKPY_13195 [Nitrososphaeraceae archaeon]
MNNKKKDNNLDNNASNNKIFSSNINNSSKNLFENDKTNKIIYSNNKIKCHYCDFESVKEEEYIKHSVNLHKGKPAQPDRKLIELMQENGENVEVKGNKWE